MTTYPQSDEAISPYQVVSRKFAACRGDNEETVNTEKQHHQSAMYANEEFAIYNKAEIASIFNTEFLHKFGHFEKICVKSIALPPPPPPPPRWHWLTSSLFSKLFIPNYEIPNKLKVKR